MNTPEKDPISYHPVSSGTRLAGERDGVLGDAGPEPGNVWMVVKIALFLAGFVLVVMILGKAL